MRDCVSTTLDPPGVRVLNGTLAERMRKSADVSINGDGGCTLETMRNSCFASEMCAAGSSRRMHLDDLLNAKHGFVYDDGHGGDFVGCVSADCCNERIKTMFPEHEFEPNALIISNLCVSNEKRKGNIGTLLMKRAIQENTDGPCYVLVSLGFVEPSVASATRDSVLCTFYKRVPGLLAFYKTLGFKPVAKCDRAYLMRHSPTAPAPPDTSETRQIQLSSGTYASS